MWLALLSERSWPVSGLRKVRRIPDSVEVPPVLPFDQLEVALQPIIDVSTGAVIAAEALARFPPQAGFSVEDAFVEAYAVGRGLELEAECLRISLRRRDEMPPDVLLSVNVSPNAVNALVVRRELRGDLSGVIVEVTEQFAGHPEALFVALTDLRRRGALVAIDDASTGYAGLLRLATLRPDIVKLDRGLVTAARQSIAKAAVIDSLVSLSHRIGASVLGEGVESIDDLTNLTERDVDFAQGWAIAAPAATLPTASAAAVRACRRARGDLLRVASLAAPPDSSARVRGITAALAGSVALPDVHAALGSAAAGLGVDVIGLSTLDDDGRLHEISAAGAPVDGEVYALGDFPATRGALDSAVMIEAHVDDPDSDPAERKLLAAQGMASLLLIPVVSGAIPLGVLEFQHRTNRRWTNDDMTNARTLAEHIANVLLRLPNTRPAR
jgi:EAL domain-containing protein (putative c-di-GMP-specific phosphodiesterase class I)